MPGAGIGRRSLLLGAGAVSLPVVLGGCSRKPAEDVRPHPDVAVLTAAMIAEEHLIALYDAVRSTHSGLTRRLDPLLAHHRDHLSALRMHYRPGSGSKTTLPPGPGSAPSAQAQPTVPPAQAQALATLRLAERQAAAARIKDVERVEPAFAQLLASIGACEAGHAMALTRAQ